MLALVPQVLCTRTAGEMAFVQTWKQAWTIADPVKDAVPWYTYSGTSSSWHCYATTDRGEYTVRRCTIVSGLYYQSALILTSKVEKNYIGSVQNINSGHYKEYRVCGGVVPAGTTVVCFAPTVQGRAGESVQGYFIDPLNGAFYSPTVGLG